MNNVMIYWISEKLHNDVFLSKKKKNHLSSDDTHFRLGGPIFDYIGLIKLIHGLTKANTPIKIEYLVRLVQKRYHWSIFL